MALEMVVKKWTKCAYIARSKAGRDTPGYFYGRLIYTFVSVSWGRRKKNSSKLLPDVTSYRNSEAFEHRYLFRRRSSANTNPRGIRGALACDLTLVKVDI